MINNALNRRHFLKAGVAGLATLGAAGAVSALETKEMPEKWDEEFDVVVVGSGFAGLAAAIEAKNAGASVAVLEKMRTAGGNSIINGGIMGVPGTPMQKKHGIVDTPALMAEDMIREGLGLNYPDKVRHLCDKALETWQWTVDELGVEWNLDNVMQEGGHSVPRCAVTANGSGSGIVRKELERLKSLDVPVRTRVFMEHIIRDEKGRVRGLQVREGYRFPNKDSGKVKYIKARRAVVLCHGGFAADVKYRMLQDPKLSDRFDTTNQPGATAEAWRESSRIGCQIVQADWIQCGPWTSPDEKGMGIAAYFASYASAMFGVWVDANTGKRFVNELANRKVRADAIIDLVNQGHQCLSIADSNGIQLLQELQKGKLEAQLKSGCVKKYETMEEMCRAYDMDPAEFQKTVDYWNECIRNKNDPEWNRYVNADCKPMGTGPWYVSRLMPKTHHCMGGIVTDPRAQALDIMTDQPIPGLYAAGESTGGVHGAVRLGSCACADCLIYGRIAGQNAAKEPAWS